MKKILLVCLAIVFSFAGGEVWAQGRTVSGKVTSAEDGTALPGVNIVVKGSTTGTVTDASGNFTLTVPAGSEALIITFIGLTSQEITLGDKTQIDVIMKQDSQQLSEVVVTALGISRDKESIGYAVSQVGGEDLAQVNQTNFVNSLSGRVAGVQITGASGNMGGSSRITIRGINSITGNNSPLFVVDGVIINNSDYNTLNTARGSGGYDYGNLSQDINPEDIATMSVLKGPNAAALYGSRGANGVIMITTKKGNKTKGLGVRINSGISFDKVYILPKYQNQYGGGTTRADNDGGKLGFSPQIINGTEYLLPDYATDESWGPRYDGQMVLHWNSFDPWDTQNYLRPREWKAPENDVRSFFNTGVTVSNSLELAGSNDASSFRLSYTRMDLKGYMPNSTLDRNTINFSGTTKLGKVVEAFTNFNYVKSDAYGRPSTGYDNNNIMQKFNQWGQRQLDMEEMKAYKNPDGSQRTWNRIAWDDATPNYSDNPYWTRYENYQNDSRNRFYGNIGGQVNIADWLKFKTTINADYYNLREMERVAIGSQAQSGYYEGLREFLETNMEAILLVNKQLGQNIDVVGSLGMNRMDQHFSNNLSRTQGGLVLPDFFNLSNAVSGVANTDYDRNKRINSVYGSVNVGYKNTIYLELMARNDWSSALTPPVGKVTQNSYFYPAVNTSFVFTNLPALNSITWLSQGKLRAGWAKVGNDTDAYNNNLIYNADLDDNSYPYTFGGVPLYSVSNTKNNPNLRPENISSFEIGSQLSFLNGRAAIDFSYYTKKSTDLILPLQVSGSTGVSRVFVNAGEMTNKGFEVLLTGTPVQLDNGFAWDVAINWSANDNKITRLYEDLATYTLINAPFSATLNAMVGESYGSIRGTDFVYDENGNKVISATGRYVSSPVKTIGNILPDWTGGITNTFKYKGIDLSVLIDVREGGQFFSTTHMFGAVSGILEKTAANGIRENGIVLDGVVVTETNQDGSIKSTRPNTTAISAQRWGIDHNAGPAKQNVFDASYVKLREIRLGYSIPARYTGPIKNVKVSAYGRNLAIWGSKATDFVDPENTTSSGNIQGLEGGALPSLRSYGFNIGFGF